MTPDHVVVRLRRSRSLFVFLLAAHALAALAVTELPVQSALKIALMFALSLSLIVEVRRRVFLKGDDSVSVIVFDRPHWYLLRADGERCPVSLEGSVTWPGLVSLDFVDGRSRRAIAVPRDGADPRGFRHLKILLRYGLPADQPKVGGTRMVSSVLSRVSG